MRRHGLRDDQWDQIKDFLPGRPGSVGVTAADNRTFVEAVLYRYKTGIPWRDLPEEYGDWNNTHRRFSRWAKSQIWEQLFTLLAVDADNEYAMIDSTIVRAHQHSAGARKDAGEDQAIGRSRGGLSCKIHALVDALGNPVGFHLTGGEAHDLVGADHLLPDMQADMLIADKAYDADRRVIKPLRDAGKAAVIPPGPIGTHPATTTATSIRRATWSGTSSPGSSSFVPSQRATIRPHATSAPPSISPLASLGRIDDRP